MDVALGIVMVPYKAITGETTRGRRGKHGAWRKAQRAYGEAPKARNRSFLKHIIKNPYLTKRLDVSS